MARTFLTEDFLLEGRSARRLYHDYAEGQPILDYHCHISVKDIAENRRFRSITEAWLEDDHYKWRAMRAQGIPERLITGDAPDREKFDAWAGTVPATIGNPLYHWTHLELVRYFGVRELLSPRTASTIYGVCNERLARDDFRARGLLSMRGVRVLCTTDDPVDSLTHHDALWADTSFPITVVPAFRPEAALAIEDTRGFQEWLARLQQAAGFEVAGWRQLIHALRGRIDFFHQHGCRISDHAVAEAFAEMYSEREVERIFMAARAGNAPSADEARVYASALLLELGRMYAEKGWAWQLHLGSLRNVSTRGMQRLGPNKGYDTIGDFRLAQGLARLLDRLDSEGRLPRTILYSSNPTDNAVLVALAGCFQDGSIPGKMQHGSAWWFNDQKDGMEEQMRTLANLGLLSRFVGMVTDSRSFLSYTRHEYFRRVLANLLGGWMDRGLIPRDCELAGGVLKDICWGNAQRYFGIPLKTGSA